MAAACRFGYTHFMASRRIFLGQTWLLFMAVVCSSCARPIEVALMTKLETGSVIGASEVNASRLFAEDAVDPKMLSVRSFDDGWEPAKARMAFEQLRKTGIKFLVTSHPSNCALAIAELAEEAGILTIDTGSTTDRLSEKDDLLVRIVPGVRQEQSWIAAWVVQRGYRRVLVVRDQGNEAYTAPALNYFSSALIGALPECEIRDCPISFDALDPAGLRLAMARSPYDLCYILVGSYRSSAGAIAQLSYSIEPSVPVLFTPWMKNPALIDTAGPALSNAFMPSHFAPRGSDPRVDAYVKRFRERFGYAPTAVSLDVYRALFLLDRAFREGARTPQAVKRWLLDQDSIETPLGGLSLDANGDVDSPFFMIENIAAEF